jgi:predicted LPLAT superfamily acyltransferase
VTSWKGKTRGGLTGYKIFVFVLKYTGLGTAYFLLSFVAFYFFLFNPKSFRAIFYFYRERLNKGFISSVFFIYRNYYALGQVLLDKFSIMAGLSHKFSFTFEGEEYLEKMAGDKTGGLLIGAHIGNFEMAGYLLNRIQIPVNVVMYDGEHEKIKDYISTYAGKNFHVIVLKEDNSHIFEINDAVREKQLVCINGDRFVAGNKTIEAVFLGEKARFPHGPFYLCTKYNMPVSFVFAMREKNFRYHFYATPPHNFYQNSASGNKDTIISGILSQYIAEMEKILGNYPTQWFNYYNFWQKDGQ